jgi:uncharacterized membrane protein
MYGMRRMDTKATLTGAILFGLIILPVIIYLPHYLKEEALLRDLPVKISRHFNQAKFKEADKMVAQNELEMGKKPNNLTPLRAVTQLHVLAMKLSKNAKLENEKLKEIKENLQKFKTITNGYKYYRELIQKSEKLVKKIENSNGRIFFDKEKKSFKARN